MSALNPRIAVILRERREQYFQYVMRLIAEAPPAEVATHTPEAGRQMTDGLLSILFEALEGNGREIYDTYVESLIPAVTQAGVSLRGLVGGTVHLGMLISADVAAHLPEGDRQAATDWFAYFYAGYVTDVAAVATRSAKA